MRACLLVALCFAASSHAIACDFRALRTAAFDQAVGNQSAKPHIAKVRVESIVRGDAIDPEDSCSDTGVIEISIVVGKWPEVSAFSFDVVSGRIGDFAVQSGPIDGSSHRVGSTYVFVFPWIDGASEKQEPMNFRIRVTPYDRFGHPGAAKELSVHDPGRPAEAHKIGRLIEVANRYIAEHYPDLIQRSIRLRRATAATCA